MKPDDFLESLVSDLKPVKVRRLQNTVLLMLGLGVLACVAAFFLMGSLRPDLSDTFARPMLAVTFATSLLLGALLVAAACISAFPGRAIPKILQYVIGALTALNVGWLAVTAFQETAWSKAFMCSVIVMVIALPATSLIFHQLRKSAPIHPVRTGMLAAFGWGAVSGALCLLSCSDESASHLLLWHYLAPVAVFGAVCALGAKKFLKW